MIVLVRFKGDNDFHRVMKTFGELLLPKVQEKSEQLTPEKIAGWFNTIAPTLYEILYDPPRGDEVRERLRIQAYLQITSADVYIDQAVTEKMTTAHQWANYDSVMVDGSDFARNKVYLV